MTQDIPFPAPPSDPVFQYLVAEAAINAAVPVYGIVVSAARLVAFDPAFHPENSADGEQMIRAMFQRWNAGNPVQPWVYPRGDMFVVSDDYIALAAIRQGQAETVACQCLGTPNPKNILSSRGPMPLAWVRQALNLPVAD